MNNLHRELAPVSDAAWEQIEEEATRTLKRFLAARRVVDVTDPQGGGIVGCWDRSCCPSGWPLCRGKCSKTSGTAGG
ncbi:encapsulin [Escherichia coli]|uniref:encapsulin n=1 Tax=Escherichia coli TaxID=562 RepID=UPI0020328982|nr:family 1 encapsulin nanocompartment shell protein [Escherichia coli]